MSLYHQPRGFPFALHDGSSINLVHAYGMGRNSKLPAPPELPPFFFDKPIIFAVADGSTITIPASTKDFAHECELLAIIGDKNTIVAYAPCLELGRRDELADAVKRGESFSVYKGFPGSLVIGAITPVSLLGAFNPNNCMLQTIVNGAVAVEGAMDSMVWSPQDCVDNLAKQLGGRIPAGTAIACGAIKGITVKVNDSITGTIPGLGSVTARLIAATQRDG